MSIQVYRLDEEDLKSNAYNVNLSINLVLRKDKIFETKEEACHYIRERSRVLAVRYQCPLTDQFLNDFCFNNALYLSMRRYFLEPPQWSELSTAFESHGVRVLR